MDTMNRNGTTRKRATASGRYGRTMLTKAIRDGVPEPEELERDVLIKGAAHQIFTGPGEGKTWVALWLITRAMLRGETVMYFDAENGKRIISERLQLLGVGEDVDDYLHYYDFPAMGIGPEDAALYRAELDEVQPDLIVFDSWVGFLAGCGLDENSNTDVEAWATAYISPAKERGCTPVILDHVGHTNTERSRAASRKKDLVDVQWRLKKVQDFSRNSVGYLQLNLVKDRESWLPKRVGLSIGGTLEGFICERSAGTVDDRNPEQLTGNHKKAYEALTNGTKAKDWMAESGIPESSFFRAVGELREWEHVRKDGDRYYLIADDVPPF